jgi:7-carboxy-7-deazaguanine synthase
MAADSATLKVSEIFESLQGEGVSAGAPAIFVRLAQCNLHCVWCDTKYTWDFERYRYEDEVREQPVAHVAQLVNASPSRRLVLTGGEPLLQQRPLKEFFARLAPDIVVEVETNGTIAPEPESLWRVNQWNVSAKLSSAGDPEQFRIRPEILAIFRDSGRAHLKLVVHCDEDYARSQRPRTTARSLVRGRGGGSSPRFPVLVAPAFGAVGRSTRNLRLSAHHPKQ